MLGTRPTFYHLGSPVRAAGVLVWTYDRGRIVRLFRKVGRWEDMGGKTDKRDTDPIGTAVREASEETNGKLFSKDHTKEQCEVILYRQLINNYRVQYIPKAKYLLYHVYVDPSILRLSMKRFGLYEKTEWGKLRHYYKWFDRDPRNLHPRLTLG